MSREAIISIQEKINEARAKQRWHGIQEMKKALEIQGHIKAQAEIEDTIMAFEVDLHGLKRGISNDSKEGRRTRN